MATPIFTHATADDRNRLERVRIAVALLPQGDAGEVLRIASDAVRSVIGNQRVWDEEKSRGGAQPLGWPSVVAPRKYTGLLVTFGKSIALECVARINKAHGAGTVPNDIASPQFQLVLRVTARAVHEIHRALTKRFGCGNRVSILRHWKNWIRESDVRASLKLPTRAERSTVTAGISRAAKSRALKRFLNRSRG